MLAATMNRFKYEIVAVLMIKLLLIIVIKMVWFSDAEPVSEQQVANQLLAPARAPQKHEYCPPSTADCPRADPQPRKPRI